MTAVVGVTPSFMQRLADERVDERAFAGIELADDDEQEQLVELGDRLVERFLLVVGRVDPCERGAQPHQQGPLLPKKSVLFAGEHAGQHKAGGCTNQTMWVKSVVSRQSLVGSRQSAVSVSSLSQQSWVVTRTAD